MDLSQQLETLKQSKRSVETLKQLEALLEIAKTESETETAIEIIKQMVEIMRYLRMHSEAIHLLETESDFELYSSKSDHLTLIDELIKTLLRTEDFIKLESVLLHRERFLTNDHQKVMQKFYLAVCYEGLEEYKKAIDTLKQIQDNISSSNLVSKYLKLAMLSLKENHIQEAKEHYDHAVKFDRYQKNPIFLLTESDILAAEGNYQEALSKYQEYFVKSKNKHRYLDRYILINIKLQRLDEAWRFYQEYLPTMKQVISKNYRLIFYQAAIELVKLLQNTEEIKKLEFLIEELEPEPPMLHTFDSVYRLLSSGFRSKRFQKPRDVVMHVFSAIESIYKFQKLLFIAPSKDHYLFYHYSKGLLLEKEVHPAHLAETILERIIAQKPITELYGYDDIIGYQRGVYKTVDTMYVFANGIEREKEFNQFIAYSSELDHFDIQQKLVLLAAELLRKLLHDFDQVHLIDERMQEYSNLLNRLDGGIIKIEQNTIYFENDQAKLLFGVTADYLAFEEFQTYLDHQVFLDDFLYTDRLLLKLKDQRMLECLITKTDFIISAYIQILEVTNQTKSINPFYPLPDERQLEFDFSETRSPKTICLIDIRNYQEYLRDYNHETYQAKLDQLKLGIEEVSRQHFRGLYLESFSNLYLVIDNTDKRVTKRITDQLVKLQTSLDLRLSLMQINHSLKTDKLIQLKVLNALTDEQNKVIFDNKNFRYNQELSKTILINVNKFIEAKRVPLCFTSVHDASTQEIKFYMVSVSQQAMLGENKTLERVLISAGLEAEWDYLMIHSLAILLKQNPGKVSYVLTLSNSSWQDAKQMARIERKIKGIPIILSVDLSESIDNDVIETFHTKGITLWGSRFIDRLNPKGIQILKNLQYLELCSSDLDQPNLATFLKLLNKPSTSLVLNYGKSTVKRSDVTGFGIDFLYGQGSEKHESVTISKIK
ncbi:MAG: hypothetical protein JXB08_04695 [Bacilli bacterium]|nr:hypothetical protein [Bacilli bacterium]MBN2877403.1 hypothetical protein [Bacilli bacterium]